MGTLPTPDLSTRLMPSTRDAPAPDPLSTTTSLARTQVDGRAHGTDEEMDEGGMRTAG
jgi:hypothetical protein